MKPNEVSVLREIVTEKGKDVNILKSVLAIILKKIQELSSCQSVAIRLNENGDYPYVIYEGFPKFFIHKESSLNVKDSEGNLVLDADNTPFAECMCGNVIKGRFDPKLPYFSERGSFWTNSTTQLIANINEEERQVIGKTRDMCHYSGYESVALIPMQANNRTLGLIQLNDPRENMFTPRIINKYESIVNRVAEIVLMALEIQERIGYLRDIINEFGSAKK